MRVDEGATTAEAVGTGPIDAFLTVMRDQGVDVTLYDYSEHTMSASGDAKAASYVELDVDGTRLWGVGIDADIATASLKAIVSAVNRAVRAGAASGAPELVLSGPSLVGVAFDRAGSMVVTSNDTAYQLPVLRLM